MRREKKLKRLEAAIEEFEAEQVQIQHQLQQGSQDHVHLAELAERHEEIEARLANLLDEWTTIGKEL
jgi:Tfp pilus assembly protein PilO